MKLVIFGATGRTGQHLIHQALDEGHWVTVLVRDPAKITMQNERLTVIKGSLLDGECVNKVIAGADAVLSGLGPQATRLTLRSARGCRSLLTR